MAKGFTQKPGVDFSETYAHVICHDSISAILAYAVAHNMQLQQFDIGTSFLNGDLLEEIYMHQLEGFVDPDYPAHCCLLLQSLYGLKQSARQWNKKMDSFFKKWHLISSDANSCLLQ